MPVDNSTLTRLHMLSALACLEALGAYVKLDRDYAATTAKGTQRVYVSVEGREWELLVNGAKFFDTRAGTGGGGAIDLVMHLRGVSFKKAARMHAEAGV